MAPPVEERMAAARGRFPHTAPGGGEAGALDPQRMKAAAALQRRKAAHGECPPPRSRPHARSPYRPSRAKAPEQLKGLKDQLRDLQSQLTETLSVKSCRESKAKLTTESISDATAMIEQLGSLVTDLREKRDKRTPVITQQLQALEPLEEKSREDAALQEKNEEAVLWYEKFLGLKVVGQEGGVKFVFNNIDLQSPEKEYSLCIRFDKDRYTLLECDVHIEDVEGLMKDLNLTDNLIKFLRIVREKFQSYAMNGTLPVSQVAGPDVSAAPSPSPMATSVEGRSEDVTNPSHSRSKNKKQHLPAKRGATALSAASPGSLRRSSRAKEVRWR